MKSLTNKKDLKNLVKECVKEVLFEEGIISNLVSEIAAGFVKANLLEAKQPTVTNTPKHNVVTERVMERVSKQKKQPKERKAFSENKKKMTEILKSNFGGVDLFEGTTPAPESKTKGAGTLTGVNPNDPGVDISSIPGMNSWKHLIK
jgi:uncharacterized protein (DUF362 family)